ncbi:HNH endonuclease family protein [Streptomyces sp. NBC_01429]|uniref:HNH endonuclease family protein n=1 Tax=Streptomyces sp. NBC_01429 TaxID=2903862 RepID=UPI002E2C4435|nr:HNH endonuclease family protein [Streptomyces sp. NBC_01429]
MRRLEDRIWRTFLTGGALVLSAVLLTGCDGQFDPELDPSASASASGDGDDGGGGSGGSSGSSVYGVLPLANPDGTKRGLAPITAAADEKAARELIETLETARAGSRAGYDRKKFGYAWMDTAEGVPLAGNGCDTRNDLLARDGKDLKYRSGSDCIVISMTLNDPYTGKEIEWRKEAAAKVQIDHVMPLSYDWQMGASRWTASKRKQIANDPLNLIPVDGSTNGSKSDSGPADWLPPNERIHCAYSARFAQVALKYELPVTTEDKSTMLEKCGG